MLLTKIVSLFAVVATAVYATPVLEERGYTKEMKSYRDHKGHEVKCRDGCYWDWKCQKCPPHMHWYGGDCCDSSHYWGGKCNKCPWGTKENKWGKCVHCEDHKWWGGECHHCDNEHWWGGKCHDCVQERWWDNCCHGCDHKHWYHGQCNHCEKGSHWDGYSCHSCHDDCWWGNKCNQCNWKHKWHKEKNCCWDDKNHCCAKYH